MILICLKPATQPCRRKGTGWLLLSIPFEVVDKLLNGDFDLVLLCHTMPDEDRRRLARIIGSYSPSAPVLFISDTGC